MVQIPRAYMPDTLVFHFTMSFKFMAALCFVSNVNGITSAINLKLLDERSQGAAMTADPEEIQMTYKDFRHDILLTKNCFDVACSHLLPVIAIALFVLFV